jgi:hypothetical protein
VSSTNLIDMAEAVDYLRYHVCEIQFRKKDGSTRVLQGTLDPFFFPSLDDGKEATTSERKKNDGVLAVWDTENDGWRSFIWNNMISFKVPFTPEPLEYAGPLQ